MQKDLSNHSINPTLLERKENANDCVTSTWQGPKKNTEPVFAVNEQESARGNNSRATKNMTTRLTLKQVGGSTKGRGETYRQLRQDRGPTCKQLRHRREIGTKPIGRRAIGILSILQVLTIDDFFRVRTFSAAWRKTSSQSTESVNSTFTNTARTELHTA